MKEFELKEGMMVIEDFLANNAEKLTDHESEEVRKFARMLEIMKERGCFPLMGKQMTNHERIKIQYEAYEEAYGEPMPEPHPMVASKPEVAGEIKRGQETVIATKTIITQKEADEES